MEGDALAMFTRTGGSWTHEYTCKAGDTKLTNITDPDLKIPNGSTCLEMDTLKIYMYDKDAENWLLLPV